MAANGSYDFEFTLFDSLNGGFQIGGTLARNNVAVAEGIFAVQLDFGAAFSGDARYLEIRVRQTGQPGMTILAPRQRIDSSPYAIRSLTALNANSIGGQTALNVANAVIAVNSATPANTPNTLVMRTANGDISAGTILATQQYNIGAFRVLGINGANNIFVGVNAGVANSTGNSNAFFGSSSGQANNTGDNNSFFGMRAGFLNTTGNGNTFIGNGAAVTNTIGSNNTVIGAGANVNNPDLSFATAIGAGAVATNSNFIQLGRNDGSDSVVISGRLFVVDAPSGGSTTLCRGNFAAALLSTCSSSLRYKTSVETFTQGLSVVRRLRPIAFDWKESGVRDVGFAAEEVSEIEPLLVTYEKGRIEGVKYGQVTTVLVNAVNEQQAEIEGLRRQIRELKSLICAQNPDASLCDK